MRPGWIAVCACAGLAGCNLVFPIEANPGDAATPPLGDGAGSFDKDGDGILDGADNCVGVPNPGQEDDGEASQGRNVDGIGDACDPFPLDGDDVIAAQYLFYSPDSDPAAWVASGTWVFGMGHVDLVGFGRLDGDKLGLVPRKLVVEASFSFAPTAGDTFGLALEPTVRGWMEVGFGSQRTIYVQLGDQSIGDSGQFTEAHPSPVVLQVSRRPASNEALSYLKTTVKQTDPVADKSLNDMTVERDDRFGVFGDGTIRVHHVVVYAGS